MLAALLYALAGPAEFWLDAGLWQRVGRLAGIIAAGAVAYFATLFLLGFRLADFDRREHEQTTSTATPPARSCQRRPKAESSPGPKRAPSAGYLRCGQRGFVQSAYRYSACSLISKPRSRAILIWRFSISAS